jgi:RWD domain
MSDQKEEQLMEAEALEAIFESSFEIVEGSTQPFVWRVTLWPEATTDEVNHVGVAVTLTLPEAYPDGALPECEVSILKGLTSEHANTLLELAREEAQNNEGVPSVFAICERIREWLVENNQKGLDDTSAFAQMMRRDAEAKKKEIDKQVRVTTTIYLPAHLSTSLAR